MGEKTTVKWHEIINAQGDSSLQFLDLYREYADAVKQREAEKKAQPFWPYPR